MFKKGQKFTKAHRQKISEALSKRRITEETRKKLSIAQKMRAHRPFTEEERAKISKALMGNKNALGKTHTDETKEKIRKSMNSYLSTHTGTFRDTQIELIVESHLQQLGLKYIKQKVLLNRMYCVDFFLPESSTIIECDGCYYHACEQCGKTRFVERRTADAIKANALSEHGYTVVRLWEHTIMSPLFDLSEYLSSILRPSNGS